MLKRMRELGKIPLIPADMRVAQIPTAERHQTEDTEQPQPPVRANVRPNGSVLLEYEFGFHKAMATFKHQMIFDVRARVVSEILSGWLCD
jgi:hypothetical protein